MDEPQAAGATKTASGARAERSALGDALAGFMERQPQIVDESIREQYDHGSCMYLSLALNEATGLPIEATIQHDPAGSYVAHSWVVVGDLAIDAMGAYELSEARESFAGPGTELAHVTADELVGYFCYYHTPPEERAADLARKLAEAREVVLRFFGPTLELGARLHERAATEPEIARLLGMEDRRASESDRVFAHEMEATT